MIAKRYVAAGLALAAAAVPSAMAAAADGPSLDPPNPAAAEVGLAELTGELRAAEGEAASRQRGRALGDSLPGPAPAGPTCTVLTAGGDSHEIACSQLPRDGCSVPTVRLPGEIDCSELDTRGCSFFVPGHRGSGPGCGSHRGGHQARPLAPSGGPRVVGSSPSG